MKLPHMSCMTCAVLSGYCCEEEKAAEEKKLSPHFTSHIERKPAPAHQMTWKAATVFLSFSLCIYIY